MAPRDALIFIGSADMQARIGALAPFAAPLTARAAAATAYVCVEGACHAPTAAPEALASDLRGS